MNIEEWRPVVGFEEHYIISNLGNIKNIAMGRGRTVGRVLKVSTNVLGYKTVELHKDGVRHGKMVHRLIAKSFIKNQYNKPNINHIDCNPSNNDISNLEWCTQLENMQHAAKLKRMSTKLGTRNGRAKLTDMKIINIRHCRGSISQQKLASLYGVSQNTISDIWSGKKWRHI